MNLHLSRRALLGFALFTFVTFALLALFLLRSGALPSVTGAGSAWALVPDAENLPPGADVLVHGVKVGSVAAIGTARNGARITLALQPDAPQLHSNASIRIGFKTALGEAFVDLSPGTGAVPLPSGARLAAIPSIEFDDALGFLDSSGRRSLREILTQLGAGIRDPARTEGDEQAAVPALHSATLELGRLTSELRAQRAAIARTVNSSNTILDVLAAGRTQVRSLTADARTALTAIGSERTALGATVHELPVLETALERTLAAAPGLIQRARPAVAELARSAPSITRTLRRLPVLTGFATAILSRAGAIARTIIPVLHGVQELAVPGARALTLLGPALADLVPVAQYLGPRGNTIAAWFANTADLGSHGDAKGRWARFFVMFDPATLSGSPTGAPPGNAYTSPGDAARNEPYRSGGYPRLEPYWPALGK
jgi:phospholipid/cholesterol/gamma-HCH transport system substrate-binding protein